MSNKNLVFQQPARGFATKEVRVSLGAGQNVSISVCLDVGIHSDHTPSTVSGLVKQGNGVPLADVVVKILNPFDQRVVSMAHSDSSGRYRLEVYLGGQYVVLAHKPGVRVAAVPIVLFDYKSLDFTLLPLKMSRQ